MYIYMYRGIKFYTWKIVDVIKDVFDKNIEKYILKFRLYNRD